MNNIAWAIEQLQQGRDITRRAIPADKKYGWPEGGMIYGYLSHYRWGGNFLSASDIDARDWVLREESEED